MSEISEIYKQIRVHIGLQMCKRKFISVKYTRRYSDAKFGTFFSATRYCLGRFTPHCVRHSTDLLGILLAV